MSRWDLCELHNSFPVLLSCQCLILCFLDFFFLPFQDAQILYHFSMFERMNITKMYRMLSLSLELKCRKEVGIRDPFASLETYQNRMRQSAGDHFIKFLLFASNAQMAFDEVVYAPWLPSARSLGYVNVMTTKHNHNGISVDFVCSSGWNRLYFIHRVNERTS